MKTCSWSPAHWTGLVTHCGQRNAVDLTLHRGWLSKGHARLATLPRRHDMPDAEKRRAERPLPRDHPRRASRSRSVGTSRTHAWEQARLSQAIAGCEPPSRRANESMVVLPPNLGGGFVIQSKALTQSPAFPSRS